MRRERGRRLVRAWGVKRAIAGLLLLGWLGALAGVAHAQDPPAAPPPADAAAAAATDTGPAIGAGTPEHKPSTRDLVIFWSVGGLVIAGALATITRKNPVVAVMCLVGTFFALSIIYVMLLAHFLAIIQVLVYAGAIMVLFVFVVMIINREETDIGNPLGWIAFALLTAGVLLGADALHLRPGWFDLGAVVVLLAVAGVIGRSVSKGAGLIGAVFVTYTFVRVLGASTRALGLGDAGWTSAEMHSFGTTRAVGQTLFSQYLYPFEAVSLLLLIAVVGATVLARPREVARDDKDIETERLALDARPPTETLKQVEGSHS